MSRSKFIAYLGYPNAPHLHLHKFLSILIVGKQHLVNYPILTPSQRYGAVFKFLLSEIHLVISFYF